MPTSSQIRADYLNFFTKKHGHTFVPSSPVVPHDDPTLLFTNAGMNQFKPLFLGQEKRSYTRAVNTQKCIRAGGKHNDLDDVGRSRRHGTFFEMLGNWSFGDYFKRGAIEMAWELITNVWKLDRTRLHVTCYEGDEKTGVPRDTEAADLWREIAGLPDHQIHYFGAKDNFWEMGETGPCGPCTEINIDRRPQAEIDAERAAGGRAPVNGDDPRVMEFWNLVFIQYNRNADRSLTSLPAQHVDTGMGFERICSILQNRDDMYGIDLFDPFWSKLTDLSGREYTGAYPPTNAPDAVAEAADAQLRTDIAFRVIGDHIRCLTFAITDGAVPSNEGRGYVLRRILRRAARFGRQTLDLGEPFLHKMVDVVVESMGEAFPELKKNPHRVSEIIRDEEVSFGRTLDRGISLFEEAAIRQSREPKGKPIAAEDAFKLHDTYGFPIDLTQIMAAERGMSVDIAGYEKLMEEARDRARAGGRVGESPVCTLPADAIAELQKRHVAPTDDSPKFRGADESVSANVRAIWNGSNFEPAAEISEDQDVAIILDRTNFYAEMGGQVGDVGQLASTSGNFDVRGTRIVGGYVLHLGRVAIGRINVGDPVKAVVGDARSTTQKNHTATHVLNWALRETVGGDVQQKGSLVDPEKLRFDFSHGKSLSDDEIAKIESLANECVTRKLAVYTDNAPLEAAMKIAGLRAVFGEKYPSPVRVVSIGAPVADLLARPADEKWRGYSIEFCGGTHVADAADLGAIVLVSEESVSKGVRRVVAYTGDKAAAVLEEGCKISAEMERTRSLPESDLARAMTELQRQLGSENLPLRVKRRGQSLVAELQERLRKWEKSKKSAGGATIDAAATAEQLLASAEQIGGGAVVVGEVKGATDESLRSVMDSLRKRKPAGLGALLAAVVGESENPRVNFVAAVSDDLIAGGLKAGDWIREAATTAGGGGGGRPQMAQAGGKDPAKIGAALEAARVFAQRALAK